MRDNSGMSNEIALPSVSNLTLLYERSLDTKQQVPYFEIELDCDLIDFYVVVGWKVL